MAGMMKWLAFSGSLALAGCGGDPANYSEVLTYTDRNGNGLYDHLTVDVYRQAMGESERKLVRTSFRPLGEEKSREFIEKMPFAKGNVSTEIRFADN